MKELENLINKVKLGNKSSIRSVWLRLTESVSDEAIAEASLASVIYSLNAASPLTGALGALGHRLFGLISEDEEKLDDKDIIKLGAVCVDLMVQLKLVKAEKLPIIEKDAQEVYMLTIVCDNFRETVKAHEMPKLRANLGYIPWEKPVMHIGDRKIDIIKKARRYGLLNNYRFDKMPDRYNSLNRLAQTEWKINQKMLEVLDVEASEANLAPTPITTLEKRAAGAAFSKAKRTAVWLQQVKFEEFITKGMPEEDAERLAGYEKDNYASYKSKEPMDIISKWSKEQDYRKSVEYAKEYGNDILNFIYSLDSRGRAYIVNQALLNPQGSDAAKSLLSFANPKQVSTYDMKINLANHAGEDKKSYDDRIKWVDENHENILMVGRDTWSAASMEWMKTSGIAMEKKSKFQFIAAAISYVELVEFIEETGGDDGFLCDIPVAYDATNSGLQILSSIGRDEYIAPYVNITATPKPGDVYQLVGTAVAKKKPVEKLFEVEPESKTWRKIVKRNVMTKNYDATRYGMGTQQWEDKPEKQDDDTGVWHTLNFKECKELGEITYDTCSEYLVKASELMETMKEAVSHNKKAVCTWRLPDGFLAFQAKPKVEKGKVMVVVGKRMELVIYKATEDADKRAHRSAIAPDVVHSLDAWLLSLIINKLPDDANLAFVHDAFGSDSIHGGDIQEVAKEAYYEVSSRDVMALILEQIAGKPVELPEAGSWDPQELFTADYIVC